MLRSDQGAAILFISHFIDEILRMGDDVTVLRSGAGRHQPPRRGADAGADGPAHGGHRSCRVLPKEAAVIGAPVASVRGLSGAGFG